MILLHKYKYISCELSETHYLRAKNGCSVMYVRGPFSTGPIFLQISSSRSGASHRPYDGKGKKSLTYHKFSTDAVAAPLQQRSKQAIGLMQWLHVKLNSDFSDLFS